MFGSKIATVGVLAAIVLVVAMVAGMGDSYASVPSRTYTLDADFDEGTLINVVHDPSDQLQLNDTTEAFDFLWVAVSSQGTVVKIDTQTGDVLGEYRTAPLGRGLDPSRTTVDQNGNVWVGNRDEGDTVNANAIAPGVPPATQAMGSVVHIGLQENGQCEDRNNNNVIDTSSDLGDVRDWNNGGGADDLGGVSTAEDECIIHYTRVHSTGTRHVSVAGPPDNNDVWVSGTGIRKFDLLDDATGSIIRQEPSVLCGGYGGLIDGNGVIWSARQLLRWDTALALTGANSTCYSHDSYGLCIDSQGNVWNTSLFGDVIRKFAKNGALVATFSHGEARAQGCVVDQNDDVWVAHSLLGPSNTVGHLRNDGTFVGNVTLDQNTAAGPTGVAVDGKGFIWATGFFSQKVYKIDPNLGVAGQVVFTSVDIGGELYNYSDMTGSTLTGAPENGTWTVVFDSLQAGTVWGTVKCSTSEPGDSSITVTAASGTDGINFGAAQAVTNNVDLTVADGQYLQLSVAFTRSSAGETPILFDCTIQTESKGTPTATPTLVPPEEVTPIGGIGLEPELGGLPLETAGSSGSGTGVLAGMAAAATAGAIALGGAAWYARRRLTR